MLSIFVFVFTFTSLLCITFAVLQKLFQGNFGKFQRSSKSRFGGFEKRSLIFEDSKMAAQTCSVLQARKVGFLFPK